MKPRKVIVPFRPGEAARLRAGEVVRLSGILYTARDAAHRRIADALRAGGEPPLPLRGAAIYYCGPSPALPGRIIGAAGPTTSSRMDPYAPLLHARGVACTIGKGNRDESVVRAVKKHGACYLAATGGAGALIAESIRRVRVVAFPELGPEAVRELLVEDFPAVVAIDSHARNLYT